MSDPNADPLEQYAATLWEPDNLVEIRALPPRPDTLRIWTPAKDLASHRPRMAEDNAKGVGIYAGVLPRTEVGGGKAEHTDGGRVVWIDCDHIPAADALAKIAGAGVPEPSLVVDSGHGAHVYWRLAEKLPREAHTRLLKAIYAWLARDPELAPHLDSKTQEPARVLRLPGFVNHKPPAAPCRIVRHAPEAVCRAGDWADALLAYNPVPVRPAVAYMPPAASPDADRDRRYAMAALADECRELAAMPPESGRNDRLNKAAFKLSGFVGAGSISADEVRAGLREAALAAGLEARDIEATLDSGLNNGKAAPRHAPERVPDGPAANLGGILAQAPQRPGLQPKPEVVEAEIEDDDDDFPEDDYAQAGRLEPLPAELLDAPGFIHDAVEWGMASAHYPNRPMIFASVLATLATLTARKIMADTRTRPNVYTLAVATSGVGKDTGNDLAANILQHVGMDNAIQQRFGSGEAIEDAFWDTSPAILWLCDEIDGWLRSAKVDGGHAGNAQGKIDTLLSYFTSSHKTMRRRQKARPLGAKRREKPAEAEHIYQPHLSLYGTCTPKGFFSAFNERVAGGGFLGRILVFDADRRGLYRDPEADIAVPPASVLDAARYWAEHPCGTGNLSEIMPTPRVVEFTPEAKMVNLKNTHVVDGEDYVRHERAIDDIGCSIWARVGLYAKKLALLHAASANPTRPVIGLDAVRWGWEIARRQGERLIALVGRHSADNPFQELCLKILNRLRNECDGAVGRRELLRLTRAKKADFDAAVETLAERGEIAPAVIQRGSKTIDGYRLRTRRRK